ncbi:flavodoxin [Epilithonimonas lactis]|uniref:Flavodoxin n=1 Tax=Epilithonimonas lactis TaxID=421072 RepID=A0A085B6X5_9FLAO|nr:flavodoxin [Epilithonimonas lactis]KFC18220.1 flavodoxin [Epilithonimonas lactis]SER08016.1 Flavodoxin [Epilithonimonas lactis]
MQKYIIFIISILCFFSCLKAQETTSEKESLKDKKVLIVYLSRTKNTKTIAEIIKKNVGGDFVELELQTPYPENYKAIVDQVSKENESGFLPPLKTKVENIEKYDVVFIGFPTWGMKLPPPMKSFLKQYDLKDKIIIPFNTNAGYGIGSSFDTVKELSPESKVLEGFTMKGGVERDGILFVMEGKKKIETEKKVREWLTKIDLNK